MKKQANSNHCFVCGVNNSFGLKIKFYEPNPGEVEAEICLPEQYQGYPGVVHGGIIAAMLDEAAGRSHMDGEPPRFMFTAKLDIRYRKNVPVGIPLRLVGRAGRSKGRTAEAYSAVFDQEGTLLAEADVLMVNVPESKINEVNLEEIGWKVYPD